MHGQPWGGEKNYLEHTLSIVERLQAVPPEYVVARGCSSLLFRNIYCLRYSEYEYESYTKEETHEHMYVLITAEVVLLSSTPGGHQRHRATTHT
jgi:hypothetical protein